MLLGETPWELDQTLKFTIPKANILKQILRYWQRISILLTKLNYISKLVKWFIPH